MLISKAKRLKIPPLWFLALIFPVAFQSLIFKRRGSYYYRVAVFLINIGITCVYGMLASLTFPLIGKQHLILWSAAKLLHFLNKHLLDVEGVVAEKDKKNYARDGQLAIYVCNHQTMIDLLLMGACMPKRISIAAKKEAKHYPFLGQFLSLTNAIFLDRANRTNAVHTAKKAAADIHQKQTGVWIFPEGTRSGGQEVALLPFKKGAFYMATQAKVPIIPIVMANYKHIYDAEKKYFGHGKVKIRVLPAIDTKEIPDHSAAVDKLANDVRKKMLTALKEISFPTIAANEMETSLQSRSCEISKL
ncbi:hypothetical protein BDF20DRAFT_817926 [Mycotypha africana]|uniref:uncharacterized protein n=1 Tax=Mycotypha africana TaxID=64632 RepID=UPI002300C5F1|nr:uncharacterized protein BDF20DRAFT_817926 [Mycotypha africana]KAI8982241.1 hypothetical protein BDF20DRAFT_817926 [Mycotypha africana]